MKNNYEVITKAEEGKSKEIIDTCIDGFASKIINEEIEDYVESDGFVKIEFEAVTLEFTYATFRTAVFLNGVMIASTWEKYYQSYIIEMKKDIEMIKAKKEKARKEAEIKAEVIRIQEEKQMLLNQLNAIFS